jgi:hypothetical protein
MNNNQLDALFIFSLLSYHTSTCFGRISSPSSAGRMYEACPKSERYIMCTPIGYFLCLVWQHCGRPYPLPVSRARLAAVEPALYE